MSQHRHQPYAERDESDHWSGRPNEVLESEISTLTPARALDLGCGVGADAIWMAERGWTVTAVDRSRPAIDRAIEKADDVGANVRWICGDFVEQPPPAAGFDLVTVFYPALQKSERDRSVAALLNGVAPGGTLLVVSHGRPHRDSASFQGFDPSQYLEAEDIAGDLDADWELEIYETPHDGDVVLRARRHSRDSR